MGTDKQEPITLKDFFQMMTDKNNKDDMANKKKINDYFIKITGESKKDFEQKHLTSPGNLRHGPLAKNQADFDFEFIAEQISNPNTRNNVNFFYDNNQYKVTIKGKEYNLSEILQNMDGRFTTISQDAKNFFYNYHNDDDAKRAIQSMQNTYDANKEAAAVMHTKEEAMEFDAKYQDIEPSERIAFYLYTSSGAFHGMINLLRGVPPKDFTTDQYSHSLNKFSFLADLSKKEFDEFIKENILTSAIALSGLNKLPDQLIKESYRIESSTPERIADKTKSINEPNYVIRERGFISTSIKTQRTKNDQVIIFHDIIGKDISAFSVFDFETEFLMPPTQIKYEAKKTIDGIDYYIAKPVYTLEGLTPEQSRMGLTEAQKINKILPLLKHTVQKYHNRNEQQAIERFEGKITNPWRKLTGAKRLDPIKEKIFSTLLTICEAQNNKDQLINIETALEETKQKLFSSKQSPKITENDFNKALSAPLGKKAKALIEELQEISATKKSRKGTFK